MTTNLENSVKLALVVEDDDTVSEHITKLLEARGFKVAQEFDGMAALQRCRSEKFDLVVCDIRLPRLSGISFLRNLRQAEANAGQNTVALDVIMMSSLGDNAAKREILAAGTPHFLVKPVSAAALDEALTALKMNKT